jgi:hypothetical protein
MLFRHNQKMHCGNRIDVMEGNQIIVFVNLFGRNFAGGNLAENAIAHCA